jgi:hypothetical protein
MRILDIINESLLNEASALAPKSFYKKARLISLIKRLEAKDDFLKVDGSFTKIPATIREIANLKRIVRTNYDGQGNSVDDSLMPNVIGKVPLSQLVKTNDFGGKNVSATGEAAGKANIGPTTEALKSMAIFTKLITRNKPSIDAKDVIKVAKRLKAKEELVQSPSGKVTTSSAEIVVNPEEIRPGKDGKTIKDKISIHINVSTPSFDRAIEVSPDDKEAWGILQGILTYVNTESDIGKYGRFFSQNVKRDPIHIAVVGLSGAKTDIKTVYQDGIDRGVDDQGNPIERELSHLSMSIKAGSDMYDQASGSTVEGMNKFFETLGLSTAQATAAMKSVEYAPKPRMKKGETEDKAITKQRIAAVRQIYHTVASELQTEIGNMTDREEGSYIHRLLTKLTSSIQGKGRLVYVNFDTKGQYHKLNPAQIIQLAKSVDLGIHLDLSKSEPHIYIKDMISGKSIFHVRPAILKTGRITHTFELDHLLDLVKGRIDPQSQATAVAPTANKPTANTPADDDTTQGMSAPKYNLRTNKLTKKEPNQGMAPSLEIPNMANNALDPSSHLAVAESKK